MLRTTTGPRFTLRHLAYFVAAAEAGTTSAAAADFFMTQSAMSAALSDFEKAVGIQVFVRRRGRGLTLTPSGRELLVQARQLLKNASEVSDIALSLQSSLAGPLSIGCFDAMSPAVLTPLVAAFAEEHPDVTYDLHSKSQEVLHGAVADGSLELALLYDLDLSPTLVAEVVSEAETHVLVSSASPWANDRHVELAQLAPEPLIMLTTPPARSAVRDSLSRAGVVPKTLVELENFDLVRSMVHRGLGYTLISQPLGGSPPHWGAGVVAVPVSDPLPLRRIMIVRRAGVRPTLRAQAFWEHCTTLGAGLLSTS